MTSDDPRLREVWKQTTIPVVFRQADGKPMLVRLPDALIQRDWLRKGRRRLPKWDAKHQCWEVPKAWFDDVVKRAQARFGRAYIIQPFRRQQKCAPACWNAVGAECECSCMGERHGTGNPSGRWHVVSDTFAAYWGPREYSCRLIKRVE